MQTINEYIREMHQNKYLQDLKREVYQQLGEDSCGHDFYHCQRVATMAMQLYLFDLFNGCLEQANSAGYTSYHGKMNDDFGVDYCNYFGDDKEIMHDYHSTYYCHESIFSSLQGQLDHDEWQRLFILAILGYSHDLLDHKLFSDDEQNENQQKLRQLLYSSLQYGLDVNDHLKDEMIDLLFSHHEYSDCIGKAIKKYGYDEASIDDKEKMTDILQTSSMVVVCWTELCLYDIQHLSFSKNNEHMYTLSQYGQYVQDADRLDALGAIGIARCFAYGGYKGQLMYSSEEYDDVLFSNKNNVMYQKTQAKQKGQSTSLQHFHDKLYHLPDLMNTQIAKEIGIQRVDRMKQFECDFKNEWNGL